MSAPLPFPKSFPDKDEQLFLDLLLCADKDFPLLWDAWKNAVAFDAVDHGTLRLLPLLAIRLKKLNMQDPLLGRIRGVYKLAWVKNQGLLDAMAKTVALLEENRIPVLLLKGIPLLIEAYKDEGARFLGDSDVLVHPENAKRAITLMLGAGWKLKTRQFPKLDHFSDESLPRIVKEITFMNEQRMEIDMHWRIFEAKGGIDERETVLARDVWGHARAFAYKEKQYRTLRAEDMLIHVIVHGAEGAPVKTLHFVTDAVYLIRTLPIDWDLFLEKTKKYGFEVEIYMAFRYLLNSNFISLPEPAKAAILALPLESQKVRAYYKKTNTVHAPWGGVPRLWRTYWQFEAKGKSSRDAYRFVDYLAQAWGLERKRDLLPFVWRKYKVRMAYHIKRIFPGKEPS
ncbi:MAG: nucleotidyltransferase family protein [bacterium]